ncbi:hypothetical protein KIPB_009285 [Kipferlia bialata]|uniref:Uncharacterized protein n=1 Tax=Kipferlia bialata TaxID=797122 RepID=A0A9K3GM01_9EUKA|nr:hypothetical protein KIPB_009285 [Kipferlia bialata]|eukprot:g9285.t1
MFLTPGYHIKLAVTSSLTAEGGRYAGVKHELKKGWSVLTRFPSGRMMLVETGVAAAVLEKKEPKVHESVPEEEVQEFLMHCREEKAFEVLSLDESYAFMRKYRPYNHGVVSSLKRMFGRTHLKRNVFPERVAVKEE